MMFCLAQGLCGGTRPAIAASAGISLGVMVHVAMAGAGLGALVVALPWVFDAVCWGGAGYLMWLAWRTWRQPVGGVPGAVPRRPWRAFRDGLIVNLSNPKVILFILAFVPQFTDPARGPLLPQFLLLGSVLALGGFVVNGAVGLFAGRLGRLMLRRPAEETGLRRVSAGIFPALALRLVWEDGNA